MTDKQIIIDGVNIKDCKRRIGKDNYCRYYKRLCSENNYNCIWKKYLRKEQECERLTSSLLEIEEIARNMNTSCFYDDFDCKDCDMKNGCILLGKLKILQKISECEENNE